MKKTRAKNRRSIASASRKRYRRALKSKNVAANHRFLVSASSGQSRCRKKKWQRLRRSRLTFFPLIAPEIFGLIYPESRARLLSFLRELKRLTLQARQPVRVDFRNTSRMFPEGTLLFAAELDEVLRMSRGRRLVRCWGPRDGVVYQVLQHLGLFSKMGYASSAPVTSESVFYWRVSSGQEVLGRLVEPVVDYYKDHSSAAESRKLYDGLVEAMTNSRQHAYTQPRGDSATVTPGGKHKAQGRWWMYSQFKDGKLSVSFCDLGIGIKRSLLDGKTWATDFIEKTRVTLGIGSADSDYIRTAFELGKSRTREQNRGKGFRDLKTVIEAVGGWLVVLSNQGLYRYTAKDNCETTSDFTDSIFGTVISWQVPVASKADAT